ncbi:helix-turn-helix transcriptional regulator [Parafrankia sp. EUN1f]|uniref:helix-turn-helix domain-containing protein n=1 Tax=Parafrankia sp. EUN1f TaxID=102897 RepID=UPI0001C47561|nr:helix-turn-helix transcriptional regulator [Parafrankia sp. EUN1f]EFC79299.1 hypothetical protein FrEUN1fDRAFT_7574 [Parafrankia sp. EUN1f]
MSFRALLREQVDKHGGARFRTQRELAEYLDVPEALLSNWVSGKAKQPRGGLTEAVAIAKRLGYSEEDALKKIYLEEPDETPARSRKAPTPQEILRDHYRVPPELIDRFDDLDLDSPDVMDAAWRAALGALEAIAKRPDRQDGP